MAQQTIVKRLQRCTVTRESTYGTTPGSLRVARFKDPGLSFTPKETQVENDNQSTRMFDALPHVRGLGSWEASGNIDVRPESSQLNAAATATDSWLTDLLRVCFGGYHADAGTTVLSATDGTGFTAASGDGAQFAIGTSGVIVHSSVAYPFRVTGVTGDDIDLSPTLGFTPGTGDVVYNSYSNWPTETVSDTLTVTGAHVYSADAQYTLNNGIVSELTISWSRDALVTASVKMMGKKSTGPSNIGHATTAISDVLASPIHCQDSYVLLQSTATTTRTAYAVRSVDIKMDFGTKHLEEITGANEQTSGIVRVASRKFVTATVKARFDPQIETWYSAGTALQLYMVIPSGSGSTARFIVIDIPTCLIADKPQVIEEDGILVHQFELFGQLSTLNTDQTSGTAAAPLVLNRI